MVPSYGRFDIVLSHGSGSYLYDVTGRRYLDLGGGIAVSSLGHAHPAITEALVEQSRKLIHASNFYYHEPQGRLAQALVSLIGPGKCFFCNSGAEANEGLFKLARKFGHDEGRFEVLTTLNSFHGRTLAGIAATGQEKVKKGFEPMVPGFRQVPYNDLAAMRAAISPATAAIMIEGIQGEGGVTPGLAGVSARPAPVVRREEAAAAHGRRAMRPFPHRAGSRASSASSKACPAARRFCRTASPWPSRWAAGSPSARFGCGRLTPICSAPGTHGTTYGGSPLACAVALEDTRGHPAREAGRQRPPGRATS